MNICICSCVLGWLDRSALWTGPMERKGCWLKHLLILAGLSHTCGVLAGTTGLMLLFPLSHPLAGWGKHTSKAGTEMQFALKTLFASHLVSLAQENHLVKPAIRWKGTTEQRVWIQGGHWCNQSTIRVKYDLKVFRRNRKWLS